MRAQIEVRFRRMSNGSVNNSAGWYVPFDSILSPADIQSHVMPLLHTEEGN